MVYFSLAIRNISRRKLWTALTVSGIAIGIAAIVSLISIGESMQVEVTKYVKETINADFYITSSSLSEFPIALMDTIKKLPEIESVEPQLFWIIPEARARGYALAVYGVEPRENRKLGLLKIVKGRDLSPGDAFGIVLASHYAGKIHMNVDVGDKVRLSTPAGEKEFSVIGICDDMNNVGHSGYILLSTAQELSGKKDKISIILVRLRDPEKIDQVISHLQRALGNKVTIHTAKETIASATSIITALEYFVIIIASISIIVAGFLIINTMIMSVTQRLHEIAIMKAIGGSNFQILRMFLIETIIIGVLGSLAGLFLAAFFLQVVQFIVPRLLDFMIPISIPLRVIGYSVGIGLALALTFGLYPAWRASRVRPLEIIRPSYEIPFKSKIFELFYHVLLKLIYPSKLLIAKIAPIASRNLSRRKLRTALTTLGIAISIGTVVALWAAGQGLQTYITGQIKGMIGADFIVIEGGFTGEIPISISEAIRKMPNIENVSPVFRRPIFLSNALVLLSGVEPDTFRAVGGKVDILKGRFLEKTDEYAIVLSKALAERTLNADIGDKVKIDTPAGTKEFVVVGISTEAMFAPPGSELKGTVWIPLTTAQKIFDKESKATAIFVKVEDLTKINVTVEKVKLVLGKKADIVTVGQILQTAAMAVQTFWAFFIGIAALAIVIAGLSIENTMTMSVSERTREIGILKAVGAKNWQVMKIFLQECLLLGILSGVVGIILGIVGAEELNAFLSKEISATLNVIITWKLILGSFFFAVLLTLIFGIHPAWKAARLKPVEALRYG
ncbi:MAG: ABC transporter permease [Euryarchaeota archaeon]|nr:ABC transporter permease [Euryarchaeota archaeon]